MPSAVLVAAAEAVKTAINGHVFSQTFTAARNWGDWSVEMTGLTALRVDVVGGGYATTEQETRGDAGYGPQVLVVVRKRFERADQETDGTVDVAKVDELVLLLEEIHEFFMAELIGSSDEFAWTESQIVLPCSPDLLRENKQYLGTIRLTLEASEAIP